MSRVRDLAWPSRMPEDEWEEVAQDIPAKDEPFITKFLFGRDALIDEEKKQRSGKHLSLIHEIKLINSLQTMHLGNRSLP
jgi:hypothetical protein